MKNYFKGWYFKHYTGNDSIAFIPGISIDKKGNKYAFLQIITNNSSYNLEYEPSEFYCKKQKVCPQINLGNNIFSETGIVLNIERDNLKITGDIEYSNLSPLKHDIMGPLKYIPFMECRHKIISMEHSLSGKINFNGQLIDFNNGTGYIESDYGHSFPESYLWTQCNTFRDKETCIVAASTVIPYIGRKIRGCFCVIRHMQKEYRFASYSGARIIAWDDRNLCISQGKYRFEARLIEDNPNKLLAPVSGSMTRTIRESVSCTAAYKFIIDNNLVFDMSSNSASFEFVQ